MPNPIPARCPQPESRSGRTEQQQDYSINNRSWILQRRAVAIIRRAYGVASPFDWKPHHDRLALRVLSMLERGEEIPAHLRQSYREPEPINPLEWITPRQAFR